MKAIGIKGSFGRDDNSANQPILDFLYCLLYTELEENTKVYWLGCIRIGGRSGGPTQNTSFDLLQFRR